MARFGRSSRGNAEDPNHQQSQRSEASANGNGKNANNRSALEPVQGYAASAAAGGIAANNNNMMPQSGHSVISGTSGASGVTGTTGATGASSSGGRRYGKQKSITSGISTLFRRQPSPDFDMAGNFLGNNANNNLAATTTPIASSSGGGGGGRDPSGIHATRPASSAARGISTGTTTSVGGDSAWSTIGDNAAGTGGTAGKTSGTPKTMIMGKIKSAAAISPRASPNASSRSSSRSNSNNRSNNNRGGNSNATAPGSPAAPQQYSQTQRDLLHGGAYDQSQAQRIYEASRQHYQNSVAGQDASVMSASVMSASVATPAENDNAGRDDDIAERSPRGRDYNGGRDFVPGIAHSMSTAASNAVGDSATIGSRTSAGSSRTGATSLSRELSERRGGDRRRSYRGPQRSYGDDTYETADRTRDDDDDEDGTDDGVYSDNGEEGTYGEESTLEGRRRNARGGRSGGGRGKREKKRATRRTKGPGTVRLPRRYRGFSTSISSLFLDESIVCGAIGCCGLLLSSRTEHLLNERNMKRGLTRRGVGGAAGRGKEGGKRAPSRILGIAWMVCILGVFATYAIWGFEDQANGAGYEEWYDYDEYDDAYWNDNGNNNNNNNNNNNDQGNDDGNQQNDQADDWNQQADDGVQNQQDDWNQQADDGVQNDDAAANNDDGNAVADDYYAAADDGNVAADDAVQADDAVDQNDDDAVNQDDAANYYQDDYYANRRLVDRKRKARKDGKGKVSTALIDSASDVSIGEKKHSFIGVMKMRDHKEHILDPVLGLTSQAYTNLMAQFKDEEYLKATAQLDLQLQHRHLEDEYGNAAEAINTDYEQGQQVRTIIIMCFLFLLGVIGRRRRMRTRFAILRSRAQDDHLYYAAVLTKNGTGASGSLATPDNTVMENFHEREDKYDGACSHTLFGCYPVDTQPPADYDDNQDDDETMDDQTLSTAGSIQPMKKKRKGGDFVSRTTAAMFACCCGKICQCWCQLFSICALAQEARETRLLLPPVMQRIDLITHQPFHEYAKDVNNVRRRFMEHANRTWVQHWAALSHLSRYIILGFVLITAFIVAVMFIHPMGGFDWGDALVLIATFTQSFLVLVIVFGIFHRSDLSFDAVVKFFAVGFLICVPVGFVVEGILMNGLVSLFYLLEWILHWTMGEESDYWLSDNHRYIWMLGELVNAYLVAAMVEELCKYYGFRFLEHPDLIFLTGLDRSAQQAQAGGLDSYNYDSQLVSDFSRSCESDGESVDSRGRRKRNRRDRFRGRNDEEDEEADLRTLQQQAAAITTGMISVAVGLACAENFMYVFFLGGTGGDIGRISGELAILLFRSFFPVHALSAAMQSINMIRKFIEEKHGGASHIGVGRIIFPAIVLHGTFDAILMCVNAYIEASWDNFYDQGGSDDDGEIPYNVLVVNLTAALGIVGVMAASFGWYSYQNKLQMLRLARYEQSKSRSSRGGFSAPNLV